MKDRKHIFIVAMTLLSCSLLAMASTGLLDFHHSPLSYLFNPPPTPRKPNSSSNSSADTAKQKKVVMPDVVIDEEEIPDSLLHPRWPVQRTIPLTDDDLSQGSYDLQRPENMKQTVEYNDSLDRYVIGYKVGGTYVNAPVMMTPAEYMKWSERQSWADYYRSKNQEILQKEGKEKFDFTDMHFDLGPAEKIFGPGGVRIKTQGTAELKFGATLKSIDNPSLPIRNRKTTVMNFDEKINLSVNGKVGDKVNMNLNYNTDATFDFDAQNMKLKYEGKEDEIIKLVEGGNVSFPSNNSLVRGASSLFGIRTDMQFGKLTLQTVLSQKKSTSKNVASSGGVQLTPFEMDVSNYEENRHFFMGRYFRNGYDGAMSMLPNVMTSVDINRVEVWVTNKTGTTTNTRNIIAMADLAEGASGIPYNNANGVYQKVKSLPNIRDIDAATTALEGAGYSGGSDFEKLSNARLLTSSEYTLNKALGYISLKTALQTDQVLAIAYEYTYNGVTYQVGEFASDLTDVNSALIVKALKNTSNNPNQSNWDLMMKNVYYLASSVEKDKFRLDVKFQSDTAGVYLSYIPEPQVKDHSIIYDLGADRLDNNGRAHSNGYFDFVEGYTVSNGRVFFPAAEPFGQYLRNYLVNNGVSAATADKYVFNELYSQTKTSAKQIAEKNKYIITGQYRGTSANVISLGAYNVPQGSVVVKAGGVDLKEGVDYSVDYSAGEVTILNQSIIDAGTPVSVSLESNTDYAQARKTMFGLNLEYYFSKNFQLTGTFQHLSEQALTTKVAMGSEPLKNTLWGVGLHWKKESQWLTNMLDKIPFLHVTQPSQITFNAEFAHLIAGHNSNTQDNASYLDDFENTKSTIDVSTPTSWIISSVPSMFSESSDKTSLQSGFNRSLLAWYYIDRLFTQRSSSLTPAHIKSDLEQLSNHYVREVYTNELFPNRDQSSYNGATYTLPILNLAYYPQERGPYNFNPNLDADGHVLQPKRGWGGMMRKLDTNDFETANIEYIEFWMLDPFIYSSKTSEASKYGGDFYINLGEVSEDVLRDGKKFYESGMPVDGTSNFQYTQWGKIPTQATVTYAFATTNGSRRLQDVGFNGLNDQEEQKYEYYQDFLTQIQGKVNQAVFDSIWADPANDNYHYFRGSDWDQIQAPILLRYKRINNPQGNSPDSDSRSESYDTSYKTMPDVEDINQDYTLNEYEKYYQYHVSIRPEDMEVGKNFIVDKRVTAPKLRNGNKEEVTWYQFRIPLRDYEDNVGGITDFNSIRFMRMFLTNFEKPIVLRFGTFDLVRGEWRVYEQELNPSAVNSGKMAVSAVNIEENNDKTPVNYVLPPGIRREQDPTQPQLVEANEQALAMTVTNFGQQESRAVYKNTTIDLRQYKRLQMFIHANAMEHDVTSLRDNQLAVFIRLGSDYKNNYYEYEIPLKLTAPGMYDRYSEAACKAVWPEENMLNIPLSIFTSLKKQRNQAKIAGTASYNREFSIYDTNNQKNKVTILGNPSLGEVKTMMIGVRNLAGEQKSGEVWVNELRLLEYTNEGGWAAQANLHVDMSDFGKLDLEGRYMTNGFGGLEDGVAQRSKEDVKSYKATVNLELGKFFPDKAKVSAPLYFSIGEEESRPKYNPLDTDMELKDALDAMEAHERDSIESIAVTRTFNRNFSLSNVRVGIATKGHPMPYDPANFSFSYSHAHRHNSGQATVYEKRDEWRGAMNYSWTPVYKAWEPFKKIKSKSKWLDILKRFGFNWLPQNVGFNTIISRNYYEIQDRDMEDLGGSELPLRFDEQFLWNREFTLRWDLTKNLHMNFQSATHAEIEEPYTPINKDRYPDAYQAWKDSVWQSIKHFGTPIDYRQTFTASYQLPLNLIPIFSWLNADARYDANYTWVRGTTLADGTTAGNTITLNRTLAVNTTLNMEKLYNQIPFLKKTNDRFNKNLSRKPKTAKPKKPKKNDKSDKSDKEEKADKAKKELPKNKRSFEKEVTIQADTSIVISHGKKTRRLIVSAKDDKGKIVSLKWRKVDDNKIKLFNKTDSAIKLKLTVTPKEPLENKGWYKTAQCIARVLMMVRNISGSYRNQYQMGLPGFMPTVGDAFGQNRNDGVLTPGLDFAFGLIDDNYIDKAKERGWLLTNSAASTPATTSRTEDLQLKVTLEPVKNLKIDLMASRNETTAKRIQYMNAGNPTSQSGNLTMTTISIASAFEPMGDATNGYHSSTFKKFVNSLDTYRERVEAQYAGAKYPGGGTYDPSLGSVNKYSADVMIPAFLDAYTSMGGSGLNLFPKLKSLLPNWTVRYSGLAQLPWFSDIFKSININHSYKSVYSIGSYQSYSTWQEWRDGLGFVTEATSGNLVPSSMYNIPQVTINEAFSPLLGIDLTMQNNLTCKLEYRTTRVLSLSMTSIQLNEALSKDWVVGLGYKISNFNLFGGGNHRRVKSKKKDDDSNTNKSNTRGLNHDMNLRLDFSYRRQAALSRDIASLESAASSGNTAYKLSFSADYTLSRLVSMSFFYDMQMNKPLLAANSYPTTTHDFGLNLKLSLTR